MSSLTRRLAALERVAGLDGGPRGTIEFHVVAGSLSPDYLQCDLRAEHGPDCAFQVVSRTRSGVRLVRLYGFDPAELD